MTATASSKRPGSGPVNSDNLRTSEGCPVSGGAHPELTGEVASQVRGSPQPSAVSDGVHREVRPFEKSTRLMDTLLVEPPRR